MHVEGASPTQSQKHSVAKGAISQRAGLGVPLHEDGVLAHGVQAGDHPAAQARQPASLAKVSKGTLALEQHQCWVEQPIRSPRSL